MAPLRAGASASAAPDPRRAAREAAEAARAGLAGAKPAAGLVFATPAHAELAPEILAEVSEVLGGAALVGASVQGLVAPGLGSETAPAVGVAVLAGVEARAVLLDDLSEDEVSAGAEIASGLAGGPQSSDLVILLPDPDALAPGPLLAGLREALAPATLVGAGAAEAGGGSSLQWAGRSTTTGGLAALVLRGVRPRVGVTQSCLPASEVLRVTEARGHWILELDGRPALDVYREVARAPLAADLRRAAAFVMVALPRSDSLEPGSYVVRNVVGFDAEENAFAVADRVGQNQNLALVIREPEAARADLKRLVAEMASPGPAALNLYFDCQARGAALFGHHGLEAGYLAAGLGPAPILGVLGSFEIGPVAGRAELLTYTGVLARIDG